MPNARVLLLTYSVFIIFNYIFIEFTKASKEMYYIYQWHGRRRGPFMYLGPGQNFFNNQKCRHTNCYVTSNQSYFKDIKQFDAIIFDAHNLVHVKENEYLPIDRSEHQKYIFTSIESEAKYPLCLAFYDDYFNWTWTHRLDSDFRRGYVTFYDIKDDKVMGPKVNKTWRKHWNPINAEMKRNLQYKSELAAWFVSNCHSKDKRRLFVNKVQEALIKRGGQTVDIFGECELYDCPRGSSKCARMLKKDYFFYFAFEDSFSRDYVTRELMTALDNYNIPVVFGGANYDRDQPKVPRRWIEPGPLFTGHPVYNVWNRIEDNIENRYCLEYQFLPPGSYLNARELGPDHLARRMLEISRNTSAYYNFFRWRNHLVYKYTTDSDSCKLCTRMNDDKLVNEKNSLKEFVKWWSHDFC